MTLLAERVTPLGRGGLSHRRPANVDRFWFGATYYPEHWSAEERARDPERMAAAGLNVVRMAEFAWDRMEPERGRFDFSLFDETLEALGRHGIRAFLCTPTATPPAWLTRAHPEILRIDAEGRSMLHGSRQHACYASPVFRAESRRITEAMAEHFRDSPHVVGWQTDNEFNCHFRECHCPACQKGFRAWLAQKYDGDLDRLNRAWGTAFWSQTYTAFEQIETPRPGRPTVLNPAHQQDYIRFLSDSVALFQHDQVAVLREANPAWLVFHNGVFLWIDYRGLVTRDLDVLGFDNYPFFRPQAELRPGWGALRCDRVRAWSGNFLIPELQSGPGGQGAIMHERAEPGEIRALSLSSIARGTDGLLYFRWRTCRTGAEQYWCGILDHDDVPRRLYGEVKRLGEELRRLGPAVLGTHVRVDAAVATSDLNVVASHHTYSLGLSEPDAVAGEIHHHLYRRGYAIGCVHPSDDLEGVRLYVLPHWAWFDPAWVENLRGWVENGGVLVVGARTATRDTDNNIIAATPPGCLAALCGATVAEYGRKAVPEERPLDLTLDGATVRAEEWYEILDPADGTEVVARWANRHPAGSPAITRRPLGKGAVYYVGAYLHDALFGALLPRLAEESGLAPLLAPHPEGLEATVRTDGARELWFLVNRGEDPVAVEEAPAGRDLLADAPAGGRIELAPHEAVVIERDPTA